jgi:hypothetical protein
MVTLSILDDECAEIKKLTGMECSYYYESNIFTLYLNGERFSPIKGRNNFERVLRNFVIPLIRTFGGNK